MEQIHQRRFKIRENIIVLALALLLFFPHLQKKKFDSLEIFPVAKNMDKERKMVGSTPYSRKERKSE